MDRALRDPSGVEPVTTWAGELSPRRTGALPACGRVLLLAGVACSLVWFPVARTGAGTIAGSDVVLLALWVVTAVDLAVRGASDLDVEAPSIVVLALAIAVLAALGSELSRTSGRGTFEFMLFMKRFGLAAVIPLAAARFGSPSVATGLRVLTALAMVALVVFALRPELHDLLPKPDDWEEGRGMERAMGLGMNPNNLAYAAVALSVLHGAYLPRRPSLAAQTALAGVLAGAAVCVILSGSRSGLAGALCALVFLLVRARLDARAKLGLTVSIALVVAGGLSASPVFQERLGRLYRLGLDEANVSGRVTAQSLALRASLEHPLGVGYRSIGWATRSAHTSYAFETTDSVYLDTLLAAGVPGLLALVLLLRAAWRHVRRAGRSGREVPILQAGLVAFLCFGAATVVPVSVFLAPLFFTIVSGASHARAADA